MNPSPDWIHALWAAAAFLYWRLWDGQDKQLETLRKKAEEMDKVVGAHAATLATHQALHQNISAAIIDLKIAVEKGNDEARRMADTLARVETLLTNSVKGLKNDA